MGGIGFGLAFEPGGQANLEGLILPIWEVLVSFIRRRQQRDGLAQHILEPYVGELMYAAVPRGWFAADEQRIEFAFPDHAGCCSLSMYATEHWARLAVAHEWDALQSLVAAHGQHLTGPRLDVAAEIARGTGGGLLVRVNKKLWLATASSAGTIVVGDDTTITLSPGQALHVGGAVSLRWCECAPCVWIRRDRCYALREQQGWTSALIARWVCAQLDVDAEAMARNEPGRQLGQARAAAAFLITEEGPDYVSHVPLLGRRTTSALLSQGMRVVGERRLALPDHPPGRR